MHTTNNNSLGVVYHIIMPSKVLCPKSLSSLFSIVIFLDKISPFLPISAWGLEFFSIICFFFSKSKHSYHTIRLWKILADRYWIEFESISQVFVDYLLLHIFYIISTMRLPFVMLLLLILSFDELFRQPARCHE